MVIGFYPGAGGNRYLRYLENKEFDTANISYDNHNTQNFKYRYIDNTCIFKCTDDIVLSHCVNYTALVNTFVNQTEFVIIKSDLKKSLHREFVLSGLERYRNAKTKDNAIDIRIKHYNAIKDKSWPVVSSVTDFDNLPLHIHNELNNNLNSIPECNESLDVAFSTIKYHCEYYNRYPYEIGNATEISLNDASQTNKFTRVMLDELSAPITQVFDFAWNSFIEYGKNCKIQDLYNNS